MVERSIFSLCVWNAGPLYGNDIAPSEVDINRELPFPIYLTPASSREVTSEVQQSLYHF